MIYYKIAQYTCLFAEIIFKKKFGNVIQIFFLNFFQKKKMFRQFDIFRDAPLDYFIGVDYIELLFYSTKFANKYTRYNDLN